jgi:ABC-type branched-subunit amino acid transport system substrate-binding protein
MQEGASAFIGPIFAQNVAAVKEVTSLNNIPLLAFTSNTSVAGDGVYLVSKPLEEEVAKIVDWAALSGITKIAMFGPANSYGYKAETVLRYEAALRNMTVLSTEMYSPQEATPTASAQRLAQTLVIAQKETPGEIAVLIPEQGTRLRSVAPLLPYYDVDINAVKFLGTGLWNSSDVWREPTLRNGVFAAPDPTPVTQYNDVYGQITGQKATTLSSLGYDATLMTLAMLAQGNLNTASIERPDGFIGTNGLFRFRNDGTIERELSVLQVTGRGDVKVVSSAKTSFGSGDGF